MSRFNSPIFKAGDNVMVIDASNSGYLILNKIYHVMRIEQNSFNQDRLVLFNLEDYWYDPKRFILVEKNEQI